MIAAAASYVPGFLTPEAADRWFGAPDACLAGQLAPTGRAQRVEGGYRVSGRFRFASGSGHATMMLAGCLVYDGEEVARTATGRPLMRSALLRPDEVTIIDTWHTTGLAATGSNDYVVEDRFVAEEDSWNPAGAMSRSEPLYRYAPLFLVPHAGVPIGIARAAIDAVLELAGEKEAYPGAARTGRGPTVADEGQTQEAVAVAEATLGGARAFTYAMIEELWALLEAGERVPPRVRALYRIMMTHSHQQAKEIVGSMYDIASTSSIFRGNPLDRLMRDILTACQHRMIHPKIYRPAGRMLLGMESGDPLV
jgi:alkylation response protein AidB-like acyl-CoA dehydrogenase